MKTIAPFAALAAACLTVSAPAMAQRGPAYGTPQQEESRFNTAQQRFENELALYQQALERYRNARRDPRYNDPRGGYNPPRGGYDDRYDQRDEGDYDAAQYYREGPRYQERVLTADERVYRGRDGRYYCKRNDGTTGLIVGAVAGGVLGNLIDGGHSRTAGTLLGAVVGAVAGSAIERNANNQQNQQIRCR
ncbi:glycine zipper 2TM domain-containing protein [Sphingomonas sp. AOB5]|uniref:glycine zipper 2TM domain-containing protein n=1 Tax=Sphingomonas sp. AOB5 TaxID=3034017 RepID=UPI0023FA23DC|nr:glycine zipper 2TM domain-containing protein [Sphingomonas sp. AOB5]MDF7774449.1 glycine zipper 2TM domain-containing protein [Sphingomonas sp. AOB5]